VEHPFTLISVQFMKPFLPIMCAFMILMGCDKGSSATERFRRYFQLTGVRDLTPESARQALLGKIPLGSSEGSVYEFLRNAGIGSDGLSSFYPADREGTIICRIEFDRKSPGIVKESYGVFFLLDEQRRLREIRVEKWLTGP